MVIDVENKLIGLKAIVAVFILLACTFDVYGTHNRAGEITYRQIGPLTISMTITTYTKTSSPAADRDTLEVFWGDGTSQNVQRTGNGINLPNDVKKNEYTAEHTYPGRGTYTIYFLDPNRVGNILNVNYPNSIDIPFFLSTTFTLLNSQFQGLNNSAVLLQPPIDIACAGQPFIHNPNAFDIDGDSLAYELIEPLMDENTPVSNYKFPDEILPGINNIAYIDPITGDFIWKNPPQEGEYNIAIRIKEYRKGFLINSIIRDMQIRIVKCQNQPPTIETIDEICVIAGDSIDFDLKIGDPDDGQQVLLTATGGPFAFENDRANISGNSQYKTPDYIEKFTWKTTCDHVQDGYYQVVFRAVDNYFGDTTGLATFHTVRIKVVAPPPENLLAFSDNGAINLEWDLPYFCEGARENFFQGFSIWRKESPNPFTIDTCETGLEDKGYEEIVFLTKQNDGEKYFYIDQNLEKGITYCYRIQAEFSLLTSTGSLYNRVESLPSNEVCLQISRDLPLLTKVSVDSTDQSTGIIHIRWAKPLVEELDTIENPGPYQVVIARRIINQGNFMPINSSIIQFASFGENIDTNYFDVNLNTLDNQYEYQIAFYTNGDFNTPFGTSSQASSSRLELEPSDRRITLNWGDQTPWSNYAYDVYKKDESNVWQKITTTDEATYLDLNLINGKEYCYYIQTEGTYALEDIEDPIINLSQVNCIAPFDNVPPCATQLEVTNVCEEIEDISDVEDLINTLRWNDANQFCDRTEPIDFYTIYYKPRLEDEFEAIATRQGSQVLLFDHKASENGLAGCYMVTATDTVGNESEPSNIVCKENCPLYSLPNTFTPDGNGFNEFFKPRRNIFISTIDLKIYNEWGNLVFETNDPDINWNGKKNGDGADLNAGTYYYTCRVFAETTAGSQELTPPLKGYINIIK